jgi:hypothetical protein
MSAATATTAAAPIDSSLPADKVLQHAARISIEQDKPILLDYYRETRAGTAFLGQDKDTGEKFLVKSATEYTSPVQKLYKVGDDYLVVTENSVYIVSGAMKRKEISGASL